jgi:polyhydroxybutyrate depolymerase
VFQRKTDKVPFDHEGKEKKMTSNISHLSRVQFKKRNLSNYVFELVVILTFFAVSSACGTQSGGSIAQQHPQSLGAGDYERKIRVGGRQRFYSVHVPPSYDKKRPTPTVLNFHGGGGRPKSQRHASKMDSASDKSGFIAVYPQGTKRPTQLRQGFTWNAGTCCGWAQENKIDDVAYTAALLDDLSKSLNIDAKRVFATGISNGAMMSYRLACELSDRIAAIAPVSGPMQMPECKPSRPISIMHFHGTADKFAPMVGGKGSRSLPGQFFSSVDATINFWLKFLDIKGKPRIVTKGNAIGEFYGPGKAGAEVVLWRIKGGGHTWPGGQFGFLGERTLGKMSQDISATDTMWKFFEKHPSRK